MVNLTYELNSLGHFLNFTRLTYLIFWNTPKAWQTHKPKKQNLPYTLDNSY